MVATAVNTYALPNLQGRMPMHMGSATGLATRILGQVGGAENAVFNAAQVPSTPQTPIQALRLAEFGTWFDFTVPGCQLHHFSFWNLS